jgi:2,3,4,5-tetrahydropyridine-2-carboxylate N-succinyltransferase
VSQDLERIIDNAWEDRDAIGLTTGGEIRLSVDRALALLDAGEARVAEPDSAGGWRVNQWLKKAVLLSFRLNDNALIDNRAVPGSIVRRGAFIGKGAVLMPSFVNIGAYVGEGTMVDTWATVGSCAQIGRNVHLSGGAGIGGVLEPLQANPVIIGDGAFIGARAEVAEGVRVGEGAVLSMGVYLGASTKIIDRATGEIFIGEVPPYAVVVPGSTGGGDGKPSLYCAVIVKRVDAQTRSKTAINELLRD